MEKRRLWVFRQHFDLCKFLSKMHFGSIIRYASVLVLTQIFTVSDPKFVIPVLLQTVGTWMAYLPQATMWTVVALRSGYCCSHMLMVHFVIALLN